MANINSPATAPDRDDKPRGTPIFELLRQDHLDISRLFDAVEGSVDADERRLLCQELVQELQRHTAAEAEIFYERLENEPASRSRLAESRQDHADIDQQLIELRALTRAYQASAAPDDDEGDVDVDEAVLARVIDLRIAFDRHVRSEEDEVFAAAQALLDKDEARTLGKAFAARKRALALGDGDDVDLDDGPDADLPVLGERAGGRGPALALSDLALDPGLEDRGVGSDGSWPQAPLRRLAPLGGGELDQGLEDRGVGAGKKGD